MGRQSTTHDVDKANVEFVHVMDDTKTNNQVKITLLRNHKPIDDKDTLLRFVPKKPNAEVLEQDEETKRSEFSPKLRSTHNKIG